MNKPSTITLNITIFGVGALGTLFGSRLAPLANVTLFGNWPAQIETLQRDGLLITHPDGSQSHHLLQVTNNLEQVPPADIVLLLVKSHQTTRAARQIAKILRPDGLAITLQNGLGNLEKIAKVVGKERVALGITAQGANILAAGHLSHAGEGVTYLAKGKGQAKRLQRLANLLNRSGLETIVVDHADSLVWGKLAINAAINPLTALLELPNGALMRDESLQPIMFAAANEVAQLAAAQGIELPYADAAHQASQVSHATANNRSSMLQDISRGAPTEIDAICGAVVRFGQRLAIPTPVNQFLLHLIRKKEAGELSLDIKTLGHHINGS